MNCPKCSGQMNAMGMSDGVEVNFCSGCGGIMFDAGEVAECFELSTDIPTLKMDMRQAKASGHTCPKCSKPWVEIPYLPGQDLLIDLCSGCGAIYLDKGEYPKLKSIAVCIEKPQSRILRAMKGMHERGYEVLGYQKS